MGVMQHRLSVRPSVRPSVRRALPVLKLSAVLCSGRRILLGAPMARLSILVFLLAAVFADSAGASRCGEPPSDQKVDFLGRDLERNDVNLSSYNWKDGSCRSARPACERAFYAECLSYIVISRGHKFCGFGV